jgi:hypothetical protein
MALADEDHRAIVVCENSCETPFRGEGHGRDRAGESTHLHVGTTGHSLFADERAFVLRLMVL